MKFPKRGRFYNLKTVEASCVVLWLDDTCNMLKTFKAEVGSVVLDTSFLFEESCKRQVREIISLQV